MDAAHLIPILLGIAVLLPLISFGVIFAFGRFLRGDAAYIATGAIVSCFLLSVAAAVIWLAAPPKLLPFAGADHAHAVPGESHAPAPHPPAGAAPGAHGHAPATSAPPAAAHGAADHGATDHGAADHGAADHGADAAHHGAEGHGHDHHAAPPVAITNTLYELGRFGGLSVTISYYIDALTITMFVMVTLIASCIHFYAQGYMHDELHQVIDREVPVSPKAAGSHGHDDGAHGDHDADGHHAAGHGHDDHAAHGHGHEAHDDHGDHGDHGHGHGHPDDDKYLHRPGRFHRFFQYLSLFCFSMLGLVYAGNIAMVFCFWELVGICSYFLIGFYVERQSASTAANKAFIVNRVGDFGMIIGLMILWAGIGTFAFGDVDANANGLIDAGERGLFSTVRAPENHYGLQTPAPLVKLGAQEVIAKINADLPAFTTPAEAEAKIDAVLPLLRDEGYGYWLLVVAGIGIFCGCIGKSAQFPLHTWLPDAMEGPTPVSALVHSATMVAAGVYLTARFYPVFAPEVLLTICAVGAITLFLAATIAIVANDIKRVLAYSTISQLGYMMLSLGLGGWLAGVLHLVTHAFFKSLLFLCSGSVIHAVHTNDMQQMGGLRHKMPITAYTMLIGCLAIAGAGIPFVIGLSGYYSKDAILEQALNFWTQSGSGAELNRLVGGLFFVALAGGAAITAFYMFRLWFLTFEGEPRDQERYDHAHESPAIMTWPLIILATLAVCVAWPFNSFTFNLLPLNLADMIETARPAGTLETSAAPALGLTWPNEHDAHVWAIASQATLIAFGVALAGIVVAAAFYWWGALDPAEVQEKFPGGYRFLVNKWWFDELYDLIFVRPVLFAANVLAAVDRNLIDAWVVDFSARIVRTFSIVWEFLADQVVVDGLVNGLAGWTYSLGTSLREVQTGSVRQYVLYIVVGAVALFILVSFVWSLSWAR